MLMAKIPRFRTEEEMREFWDTHDSAEYFEDMEDDEVRVEKKNIKSNRRPVKKKCPYSADCLNPKHGNKSMRTSAGRHFAPSVPAKGNDTRTISPRR